MKWVNLLRANLRKEYIEMKRYLPNTIAMMFTFFAIFLGMFVGIKIIGEPQTQGIFTEYIIVNYIFWFLALLVIQNIGWQLTNEAMRGTLEQLYMSPLGVWQIITTRLISTAAINFIVIVILLYLSMLTTGRWLNVDIISLLPVLVFTLISMFGIGLAIAGISIIWKQVQSLLQILQFIIATLIFIPLSVAPFLVYLPFVKGVDLVRDIMINGTTLNNIPIQDFVILGVNAIVYFSLGLVVFIACERLAMKKGLLAHY